MIKLINMIADLLDPCKYELNLKAAGFEYGFSSKIIVQVLFKHLICLSGKGFSY